MYGITGKILRVDLTSGKFDIEDTAPFFKKYLGGRALNHILLFQDVDVASVKPLDPENEIIFSSGPLGGTPFASSGRCQSTFIAPLPYSGWGDSNFGGEFGPEMKFAGYDAIAIRGKAAEPVYLYIEDDTVELRSAHGIWGRGITECARIFHERHTEAQSLLIGPAGEKLVRYANIRTALTNSMGRCGGGAVLGSKKLKAIVIRGRQGVQLADPARFLELAHQLYKDITNPDFGTVHGMTFQALSTYGTPGLTRAVGQTGMTPIKNWTQCGIWDKDGELTEHCIETWGVRRAACFGCPIHCHGPYRVDDSDFPSFSGGPEYETTVALGHKCLEPRGKVVLKLSEMCNDLGIDSVETGNMFATVMEWYEKGIVNEKFTDGVSMHWGNGEGMMELLPKIAFRQGCGNELAEGPYWVGRKLGAEALKYVYHQKGMGATGVETRSTVGSMVQFALSPRGSHHLTGLPTAEWVNIPEVAAHITGFEEAGDIRSYHPEAKARLVQYYENLFELPDSLGICKFPYGHTGFWHDRPEDLEKMWDYFVKGLHYATGEEFSKEELMEIGERAYQIERAVIVLRGIRRQDDMPNWKCSKEACPGDHPVGPIPLPPVDLEKYEKILDMYYDIRGWTKDGVPTRERLVALGLPEVAEALEKNVVHKNGKTDLRNEP